MNLKVLVAVSVTAAGMVVHVWAPIALNRLNALYRSVSMSVDINNHALNGVERHRRAIAAECCGSTRLQVRSMGPPESESR